MTHSRTVLFALSAALVSTATAQAQPASRAQVIGMPRAVSIAEGAGGRTLEAELDYERGRLVYEVSAVAEKGMSQVVVDALSGEIVSTRPMRLEGLWRSWFEADRWTAVRAAPTPLSQILARVETDTGAKVTEVGLERERGQTFYEIELSEPGRRLLVDPRTGAIREGRMDD